MYGLTPNGAGMHRQRPMFGLMAIGLALQACGFPDIGLTWKEDLSGFPAIGVKLRVKPGTNTNLLNQTTLIIIYKRLGGEFCPLFPAHPLYYHLIGMIYPFQDYCIAHGCVKVNRVPVFFIHVITRLNAIISL